MTVAAAAERLVPLLARAARLVRSYAFAAAAAALVIVLFLFRNGAPDDAAGWIVAVLGMVAAAAPPVVLFLLSEALRALADLPSRLRALPAAGAGQLGAFRRLGEGVRGRGLRRLPVVLWRFARLSDDTRGMLRPYAAALPLVSVPFLLLSAAAVPAAALELAVALVLLVVIAVS